MKINRKCRIFLVVFMLLGISSCTTKIAYNNLDWLISWYVDDFITLNDKQEKEFNTIVTSFLLWHRKYELQNYVLQIKYMKIDIDNGVTESNINQYIESFLQFWKTILIKTEPDMVKFAYSISDQQVTEFLNAVEKENLEKLEKFEDETKQERLENRFDKIEDRVTSFIGSLTKEQEQLLHKGNQLTASTLYERIAYRRACADAVRVAYSHRDNKPLFEQHIRRLILQPNDYRSPVYLKKLADNKKLWSGVIEQLISSLNKEQLKKLNTKLDDTIEDLEALY